ncbi:MAG TPA: hypothetical protein VN962_03480 [Polyangia bacterium]|nr:hypothetical protein [Polyangia bacterium]
MGAVTFSMDHDNGIGVELAGLDKGAWRVTPAPPSPAPLWAPETATRPAVVVLNRDLGGPGPFHLQDYLTPDEADQLAAALTATAERCRELDAYEPEPG